MVLGTYNNYILPNLQSGHPAKLFKFLILNSNYKHIVIFIWNIHIKQSWQITGSSIVPNMVQVYGIRYIQSHSASGKPKLFQISNCQITEKCKFFVANFTRISICTPKTTTQNIKQYITVFIKYF